MQPTVDEIVDGIDRISTWIPEVSPDGFTFHQFLVVADEPLLFHTGPRGMFPLVAEAVAKIRVGPKSQRRRDWRVVAFPVQF